MLLTQSIYIIRLKIRIKIRIGRSSSKYRIKSVVLMQLSLFQGKRMCPVFTGLLQALKGSTGRWYVPYTVLPPKFGVQTVLGILHREFHESFMKFHRSYFIGSLMQQPRVCKKFLWH